MLSRIMVKRIVLQKGCEGMKRLFVCLLILVLCLTGCKSVGERPKDPMFVQLPMTVGQAYTEYAGMELLLTGLQYYPDEGTIMFTTWENNTAYDVTYSDAYAIERLDGEEWVSCVKRDDLGFHDIAYKLKAGQQINRNFDLTNDYDVSMTGLYRFQTVCYVHEGQENSVKCVLTAQFTIGSEKENITQATGTAIEWCAQYIRTNGYQEGAKFPQVAIIKDKQELTDYYAANKETFDLERKDTVYADTTIGFLDACDQFGETFFNDHYLVFILLEEGSGSIRHEMRSVEQTADGKIAVSIDTKVPEMGTDDMAQWHIILELSRDVLTDKTEDILVYLDGNLAWNGDSAEPSKSEPTLKKPPELTLYTPDADVTVIASGYHWTYENSDGTAVSIIADQAGRPVEQRFLKPVTIAGKYAESIHAYVPKTGNYEPINSAGILVKLGWQTVPTSVAFTCWDQSDPSSENSSQQVFNMEDDGFYAYHLGGYIYEIAATWEDTGAGYHGAANYYVYIICGEENSR